MVSSRKQLSPCPVCSRADQVKKMQTAYSAGESHFGPPPMPESHASMMKYIGVGMILVGISAFLIIVTLSGTGSGFSWIQMIITLLFIVTALLLSLVAIRHIGQGDEEARQRYPIWDKAMASWNRLLFCARDKVVFDPQTNKALTDSAVHALLSMDETEPHHVEVHAAVSH
jgi:NADH:ubiquinone oxidoreductase subunit 3 (subunit A)